MLTFYSADTKLRDSQVELFEGQLVAPFECPRRVDIIIDRIRTAGLGQIQAPDTYGLQAVATVHDDHYVSFLQTVWDEWTAAGYKGEVIPDIMRTPRLRHDRIPAHINGRAGYYALSTETSICAGTYEAATVSKDIALTAVDHVLQQQTAAFALCRPPGHHASVDQYGGYCFFNNAAIVAEHARAQGIDRVAILDIDYHHGNGTQDIFYARPDIFFASLHCDPAHEFPYFLGYADETGAAAGFGTNHNYPMPPGTNYQTWRASLQDALEKIAHFDPGLLVISLGVDTFEHDPIGSFKLTSDDYLDCGKQIRQLDLPTVFLMEGGYAVDEIGINVVNVLGGFDAS